MGFHGRAAAHKHKIIMLNAKHRLKLCKGLWSSGNPFSGVMIPCSNVPTSSLKLFPEEWMLS
jgi:hypothetical protein